MHSVLLSKFGCSLLGDLLYAYFRRALPFFAPTKTGSGFSERQPERAMKSGSPHHTFVLNEESLGLAKVNI
jgi:hypothetical protein